MIFTNKALGFFVSAALAALSSVAADGDVALRGAGEGDRKLQCERVYLGQLKAEVSCDTVWATLGDSMAFCSEFDPEEDDPEEDGDDDDEPIMDVVQFTMCPDDLDDTIRAFFYDDEEDGLLLEDITDDEVEPDEDPEGEEMETETDSAEGDLEDEGETVEEPDFDDPCYSTEGGPAFDSDLPEECAEEGRRGLRHIPWPIKFNPHAPEKARFFEKQWNMAAIEADGAWGCGRKGSKTVRVGVLDTGIDYTHPELWWKVDPWRSFSLGAGGSSRRWHDDKHGRGTSVASVIATNAINIAGVTSKTTLVSGKVCKDDGRCDLHWLLKGLAMISDKNERPKKWRKHKGGKVDIVNLSVPFRKYLWGKKLKIARHMFRRLNKKGVTVVVAAGDQGVDLDHDPKYLFDLCDAKGVICVSSTGPLSSHDFKWGPWYHVDYPAFHIKQRRRRRHLISGSANYGFEEVDLAAPGGNWGGAILTACSRFGRHTWCHRTKPWYVYQRGTGMAAAHVSGVAAMVINNPEVQYVPTKWRPKKIKWIIMEKADDLGRTHFDPFLGEHGRLNSRAAVCPPICCSKHHNGGIVGKFAAIGMMGQEDCTQFVNCVESDYGGVVQTMAQNCPLANAQGDLLVFDMNANEGQSWACDGNYCEGACVWDAPGICPPRLTGSPDGVPFFPICTPMAGTD